MCHKKSQGTFLLILKVIFYFLKEENRKGDGFEYSMQYQLFPIPGGGRGEGEGGG